jgi:hypothetical protein
MANCSIVELMVVTWLIASENTQLTDFSTILSDVPSMVPSDSPSSVPSDVPSDSPSDQPSDQPSGISNALFVEKSVNDKKSVSAVAQGVTDSERAH